MIAPKLVPMPQGKAPPPQAVKPQIVQRFIFNKHPIFINPFGTVITPVNPEEGQATGDALLSQANSLVYYTIVVNDVYA